MSRWAKTTTCTPDLPSTQRANVAQRVVMRCLSPEDYAAALGCSPTGATPSRRGVALVVNEDVHQALVTVDHLTDEAWSALCSRAATARSYTVTTPASEARSPFARPVEDELVPVEAPPEPRPWTPDPLLHEVLAVLADADPRGLPASALLERLPAWLAPASPALLGKALRAHPEHVQPGYVQGGGRVWRAVVVPSSGQPGAAVVPSSSRRPAAVGAADDGSLSPLHAQESPAVALPSSPSSAGAR